MKNKKFQQKNKKIQQKNKKIQQKNYQKQQYQIIAVTYILLMEIPILFTKRNLYMKNFKTMLLLGGIQIHKLIIQIVLIH